MASTSLALYSFGAAACSNPLAMLSHNAAHDSYSPAHTS